MESLLLNRAYNERYCIYRNSWRYYYDSNYENADISCNYFYLGIVLIGIIVLMYAIAAVICRYRHKKADFIVCGMGAVGLYAIVYTAIMNVLISGFSEYTGSLFYSRYYTWHIIFNIIIMYRIMFYRTYCRRVTGYRCKIPL